MRNAAELIVAILTTAVITYEFGESRMISTNERSTNDRNMVQNDEMMHEEDHYIPKSGSSQQRSETTSSSFGAMDHREDEQYSDKKDETSSHEDHYIPMEKSFDQRLDTADNSTTAIDHEGDMDPYIHTHTEGAGVSSAGDHYIPMKNFPHESSITPNSSTTGGEAMDPYISNENTGPSSAGNHYTPMKNFPRQSSMTGGGDMDPYTSNEDTGPSSAGNHYTPMKNFPHQSSITDNNSTTVLDQEGDMDPYIPTHTESAGVLSAGDHYTPMKNLHHQSSITDNSSTTGGGDMDHYIPNEDTGPSSAGKHYIPMKNSSHQTSKTGDMDPYIPNEDVGIATRGGQLPMKKPFHQPPDRDNSSTVHLNQRNDMDPYVPNKDAGTSSHENHYIPMTNSSHYSSESTTSSVDYYRDMGEGRVGRDSENVTNIGERTTSVSYSSDTDEKSDSENKKTRNATNPYITHNYQTDGPYQREEMSSRAGGPAIGTNGHLPYEHDEMDPYTDDYGNGRDPRNHGVAQQSDEKGGYSSTTDSYSSIKTDEQNQRNTVSQMETTTSMKTVLGDSYSESTADRGTGIHGVGSNGGPTTEEGANAGSFRPDFGFITEGDPYSVRRNIIGQPTRVSKDDGENHDERGIQLNQYEDSQMFREEHLRTGACNGVRCSDFATCQEDTCVCHDGFEMDGYGRCIMVDECEGIKCSNSARCEKGICVCVEGFSMDGYGRCFASDRPDPTDGKGEHTPSMPDRDTETATKGYNVHTIRQDVDDEETGVEGACDGVRCSDFATCRRGICLCHKRFEMDGYGRCILVDKCEGIKCSNFARCEKGLCVCIEGFSMDGYGRCFESDDPRGRNSAEHGEYTPSMQDNSFETTTMGYNAYHGMTGTTAASTAFDVEDDKCKNLKCPMYASCDEGFCVCDDNYRMDEDGFCHIVDGCASIRCAAHGYCKMQSSGTPACYCRSGYRIVSSSCVPVTKMKEYDICAGVHCSENGYCKNHKGKAACFCKTGYTIVSRTCVENHIYQQICGKCGRFGRCTNIGGQPRCKCMDGYKLAKQTCIKNNPCFGLDCGLNAKCTETNGIISCVCEEGYKYQYQSGKCNEIDPCSGRNCGKYGMCFPIDGAPTCICVSGYKASDGICIKENPCERHPCGRHRRCVNHRDTAICLCSDGYKLASGVCVARDPCKNTKCGLYGSCVTMNGKAVCWCRSGYRFVAGDCRRVASCSSINCGPNAFCSTASGDAVCVCHLGYRKVLGTCVRGAPSCRSVKCGPFQYCSNASGRLSCECITGYRHISGLCVKDDIFPSSYPTTKSGR